MTAMLGTLLLADQDEDARLRDVVAAAAAMPDRSGGPGFAPVHDRADDATVDEWLRRAAGPRAEELRAYLARTGRDISIGLRPVVCVPGPRAAWVDGLVAFLNADGDPRRTAGLLFAGPARAVLTEPARALLDATLAGRLATACQVSGVATSRSEWLDLFERRPGLAYAVGVTCAQWAAATAEQFERLDRDWATLTTELWHGVNPGGITGYRGDAGDVHNHGRAVALLTFTDGSGIAYKPKELGHVTALLELIDFLDPHLPEPLATRRVLDRGDYGWEQLVVAAPCPDRTGFARFYRRLGMLTRLMQLLAGRDLWADNLIAAGEQPMFIDLECLLSPSARALPIDVGDPAAVLALGRTAVGTSILMQPWSAPLAMPVLDVGCLSDAGSARKPDGSPLLPLPSYRPVANGIVADAADHADQILLGYRQMHDVLVLVRDQLSDPAGPLAAFRGAWVRHIRRNTWDCYKLIRAGVGHRALAGGTAREIELAGLLRSVFSMPEVTTARADLIEMVLAEIDALRRLDIPLFGSRTDSTSAFSADGTEIPQHFQHTAWDALQLRVAELDTFDVDAHLGMVGSAIDVALDGATHLPGPTQCPRATRQELVAAAASIGDTILRTRRSSGDWIGQTWHPVTGIRNIEVLGPDLGSGTSGLAVVLAELFAATGDHRYRDVCLQTMHAALDYAAAVPAGPRHQNIAGLALVPGGLAGSGSVIHAAARCADLLDGEPELITKSIALLPKIAELLDVQYPPDRRPFDDTPAGVAGLLLNVLALRARTGPLPGIDGLLISTAEYLRRNAFGGAPKFSQRAGRVVTSELVSVVDALAQLARLAPELCRPAARRNAKSGAAAGVRIGPQATTRHLLDAAAGTDDPDTLADIASTLLARHSNTGTWFPDRYAHDDVNLGALDGIGAVALVLLRATNPAVHPITTLTETECRHDRV